MSGFLGQVPEDVEALGADFDAKATDVETLIQAINGRFSSTHWVGPDRDNFEATWTGEMTNSLNQLAQALRETGTIARNNASQQRSASA
jgi:hypothetical protein